MVLHSCDEVIGCIWRCISSGDACWVTCVSSHWKAAGQPWRRPRLWVLFPGTFDMPCTGDWWADGTTLLSCSLQCIASGFSHQELRFYNILMATSPSWSIWWVELRLLEQCPTPNSELEQMEVLAAWPALLVIWPLSRYLEERAVGVGAFIYLSPLLSILRQKKGTVAHKHWAGPSNLVKCKPCPMVQSAMVCGSDGHTYTSKVSHLCLLCFEKYFMSAGSDKSPCPDWPHHVKLRAMWGLIL